MAYVLVILGMLILLAIIAGMYYVVVIKWQFFSSRKVIVGIGVIAGLVWCLVVVNAAATELYNHRTVTCTITDKTRTSGDKRVDTAECGTLLVNDDAAYLNFHSGDTFGKLERGKKYHLEVVGARIPMPGMAVFPNVLGATAVKASR